MAPPAKLIEVFAASLKLGLTSFGGPIAHIGYFHNEYVLRRKWLDEQNYADLVALCQFLPGPASSQLGIAIGTLRAGLMGGGVAWLGFTMPSAIIMVVFAMLVNGFAVADSAWVHGLKIVAVPIVAQAVLAMWQKLVTDWKRAALAFCAMIVLLFWRTALSQVAVIIFSGFVGLLAYGKFDASKSSPLNIRINRTFSIACLIAFFGLLAVLPIARCVTSNHWISMADGFYRAGSLVFGGGHVVLPLLEKEVVPTGWISKENFLAGYGAAQAVSGPLFTFAAYCGALINGIRGAALALFSIFLPGFLLVIGVLPFWNTLRVNSRIKGAFNGVNAAVVGILLAALYNPIGTSALLSPSDFGLAALLFGMLIFWKFPPWLIVLAGAVGSAILGALGI